MNLKLKQNILLMVRALYFCMEDQWAELGKKFNSTPAQQHILFLLSTNKNTLTPTQISELGCWHISTVSRLLKPLQREGFISVSTDQKRPKYKNVTITQAGEQLFTILKCGQSILEVHKGEDFNKRVINAEIEGFDYA